MTEVFDEADRLDDERVQLLCRNLIRAVEKFQNEHHADKVSVGCSDRETLAALVYVLTFLVRSIECAHCRRALGEATVEGLAMAVPRCIEDPIHPDEPGHHTH